MCMTYRYFECFCFSHRAIIFLAKSNQLKLAVCDVPMCSDVDPQPVLPVDDVLVQ